LNWLWVPDGWIADGRQVAVKDKKDKWQYKRQIDFYIFVV